MATTIYPFEYYDNSDSFFGAIDCGSQGAGCQQCCTQQYTGKARRQCKDGCPTVGGKKIQPPAPMPVPSARVLSAIQPVPIRTSPASRPITSEMMKSAEKPVPLPLLKSVDACIAMGSAQCYQCCTKSFTGKARRQCKDACPTVPIISGTGPIISDTGPRSCFPLASPRDNCPSGFDRSGKDCCPGPVVDEEQAGGGAHGGGGGGGVISANTHEECITGTNTLGACLQCCSHNFRSADRRACKRKCSAYYEGGGGGGTAQCDSDSDCGEGKICQNGQCVTPTVQEIPQGIECTTGTGGVQCHPIDYSQWGYDQYPISSGGGGTVVSTASGYMRPIGDIVAEQEEAAAGEELGIVDWIQENPLMSAGIAFGVYWLFFRKKGRSSSSRSVV